MWKVFEMAVYVVCPNRAVEHWCTSGLCWADPDGLPIGAAGTAAQSCQGACSRDQQDPGWDALYIVVPENHPLCILIMLAFHRLTNEKKQIF